MKKSFIAVVVIVFLMNLGGCTQKIEDSHFIATVTEVHDTYYMVEITEPGNTGISIGSEATVSTKNLVEESIEPICVGDAIKVIFNGDVMETDPLQLGKTTSIQVMTEETKKELPEIEGLVPSKSDNWGITLSAKNVTPTGMTLVITQSGGEPTGELQYGSEYHLKVLKDGNWEEVPYIVEGDVAWTAVAYMVPMNDSVELEISWEWLHGSLPTGSYRISKGFIDFRGTGDYDSDSFYAEFEIK